MEKVFTKEASGILPYWQGSHNWLVGSLSVYNSDS